MTQTDLNILIMSLNREYANIDEVIKFLKDM